MMHDKQHEATARKMAGNGANFLVIDVNIAFLPRTAGSALGAFEA